MPPAHWSPSPLLCAEWQSQGPSQSFTCIGAYSQRQIFIMKLQNFRVTRAPANTTQGRVWRNRSLCNKPFMPKPVVPGFRHFRVATLQRGDEESCFMVAMWICRLRLPDLQMHFGGRSPGYTQVDSIRLLGTSPNTSWTMMQSGSCKSCTCMRTITFARGEPDVLLGGDK